MTPEQKQAVTAFFEEAREAITGTGRHEGHTLVQAGKCVYCSCDLRIGQARLADLMRQRVKATPPAGYRDRHTYPARRPGH